MPNSGPIEESQLPVILSYLVNQSRFSLYEYYQVPIVTESDSVLDKVVSENITIPLWQVFDADLRNDWSQVRRTGSGLWGRPESEFLAMVEKFRDGNFTYFPADNDFGSPVMVLDLGGDVYIGAGTGGLHRLVAAKASGVGLMPVRVIRVADEELYREPWRLVDEDLRDEAKQTLLAAREYVAETQGQKEDDTESFDLSSQIQSLVTARIVNTAHFKALAEDPTLTGENLINAIEPLIIEVLRKSQVLIERIPDSAKRAQFFDFLLQENRPVLKEQIEKILQSLVSQNSKQIPSRWWQRAIDSIRSLFNRMNIFQQSRTPSEEQKEEKKVPLPTPRIGEGSAQLFELEKLLPVSVDVNAEKGRVLSDILTTDYPEFAAADNPKILSAGM